MKDNNLLKLGDVIGKNAFWIIVPLGTIGNLLIIGYFMKINFATSLKKMSVYHYLIIQLAIVDLVTSITTPLTISAFHEPAWHLRDFWCTIGYPFSLAILPYTSCWILVLISYERYRTITRPFTKRGTKCKYSFVILMVIVVVMASVIPFTRTKITITEKHNNYNNISIIGINRTNSSNDNNNKNYRCIEEKDKFTPTNYIFYALTRRSLDCFIPASLMYLFYRRIQNWMNQDANDLPLSDGSKRRNRVALKTLRNLIIVYIACVFPGRFAVVGIHIDDINRTEGRHDYFDLVHELSSLVSLLNNVANVFVYASIIKDFRAFLLSIVNYCLKF